MRKRETYWSLFHKTEKRQLNDLSTNNVEAVFEALPKKDHRDWVIWKEGFKTWKPLSDFPQLLVSLRQAAQTPPPSIALPLPPKIHQDAKAPIEQPLEMDTSSITDLVIDDPTRLAERDTRFPKKWDVKVFDETKVYPNQTVNISMNGMQLRDPVPNGLTNFFNVEVRAGGERLAMICSVIANPDGSPSHRLHIESCEYPNALQTALLSR